MLYMGTRNGRVLSLLGNEADTVAHAWQAVQVASQDSAEAKTALAELAQRFQEMAALLRKLGDLLTVANQLRELRADLDPYVTAAQASIFNPIMFSPQVPTFRQNWLHLQQDRLPPLKLFLQEHPYLAPAWLTLLAQQADEISGSLTSGAIFPLPAQIQACGAQLSLAAVTVRAQLDQTIKDLVQMSDRTLGRLAIDAQPA